MGQLTTHVLDTTLGRPAAGVRVRLRSAAGEALADVVTNVDGRSAAPLLEGATLAVGGYVLSFHVADYFRAAGVKLAEPPFYDVIEVAFSIGDAGVHCHVPLLVSPFGYSTYRGS